MKKIFLSFVVAVTILLALYGSLWYESIIREYPVSFGISFDAQQAEWLGVSPQEAYLAMMQELQPSYIRLSAHWDDIERRSGSYDFSELDWMMREAAKGDAKVTLVVGQKTPRWPECHLPHWFSYEQADAEEKFFSYIRAVIERYKNHPALELWQVENEPFIRFPFGECLGYREDWVDKEISLVREIDEKHKIVITDSGELGWWGRAAAAGDILGTTVYRVVRTPRGFIFGYRWLPPSVYRLKAAWVRKTQENFFVSELQAEPWFWGSAPNQTPIAEQEKTMNPERLRAHIDYVRHVGASRAYLWGVEWWYWMKDVKGDSRYWDIARQVL